MKNNQGTLTKRVQRIKPSPTLAVTARANALKAAGRNIIGLGAGEPDFDTPDYVKQAAIKAIEDGFTKYTAVEGTAGLKQAIIEKFKTDNHLDYKPSQILVSNGGKQSFYNLAQAFLQDGDEVIIPAPYWVSYPDMVLLADARPVIVPCGIEQHFLITPQQLEDAITPRTKLFVLNSPSNPTGAMYSERQLEAIADVLQRHPWVYVVSDDIYEHILLSDHPFTSILQICPSLYDRCLILNGVSKAYSMTGWRIGYAAGPEWLIKAMAKVQSQSTSNPCSISQVAAQAALQGGNTFPQEMVVEFKSRHRFVVDSLNAMNGVECLDSQGAFYSFPDCRQVIDRIANVADDVAFGEFLLEHAEVALVPGSAFGAPGFMRISFATSMENLEQAMTRLARVINAL